MTTISTSLMTSNLTGHWASRDALDHDWWWVSWLPAGQVCDRNQAITAMTLAEFVAQGVTRPDHELWPHVINFAAELGLGSKAVQLASTELKPAPDGWRTVPGGQAQSPVTGMWQWIAEGTEWAKARQASELAALNARPQRAEGITMDDSARYALMFPNATAAKLRADADQLEIRAREIAQAPDIDLEKLAELSLAVDEMRNAADYR